jgi:hypothetical protein
MSEPESRPTVVPRWFLAAVIALLTVQVGMLWLHGSLLERQHADMAALREDVQDLADSLDEFQGTFDDTGSDGLSPSRWRHGVRHHAALRVRLDEPQDPEDAQRKAIENQRKAEKDAVAKARDLNEKLSITENARKADEKAKAEAATHPYRHLVWAGVALGVLALLLRSWARRRG